MQISELMQQIEETPTTDFVMVRKETWQAILQYLQQQERVALLQQRVQEMRDDPQSSISLEEFKGEMGLVDA